MNLKAKQILVYDDEGVGRSQIGRVMIQDRLPNIPIFAVGLKEPRSGRTTMHPSVIRIIHERYGVDISKEKVTLLKPEMVTKDTIVVGLTDTIAPNFLREKALDIFLAPIDDPASDLEHLLDVIATRTYYVAWLFDLVLSKRFEQIGIKRDERGFVLPRYLSDFEPSNIETKYRRGHFGYEGF